MERDASGLMTGEIPLDAPDPGALARLADALANEEQLLRRYHLTRKPEIREELVSRFLPLARNLARRYHGGPEPAEDLMQVATVGLLGAIDRFDPERGVPFVAFATPTILGELRRYLRDRIWMMRVPRVLQQRITEVQEAIAELTGALGRSPSIGQLARHLGIAEEDVLAAIEADQARRPVSLDQPDSTADPAAPPLAEQLRTREAGYESIENRATIKGRIGRLSELEREIIRLRFGEELSQSEIASKVGYSQMHVSRLLRTALQRLRDEQPPAPSRSEPETRPGRPAAPPPSVTAALPAARGRNAAEGLASPDFG